MNTLFDIQGRKAIVTGGTRGLGHGIAEGLLEAGCEVVIIGSSPKAYSAAEEFCARGYRCHGVQADLGNREDLYRGFSEAVQQLGGELDILVNAHGITRRNPCEQFTDEDWDTVLEVDLNSVFLLCREAGKLMLKKGYGKIINVSSMLAFFGGVNVPAYAAAKGGVSQLTKALANDWAGRGVCINAIAPGYMATELTSVLREENNPRYAQITARIPAGRWGEPGDVKGPVLFLASHASDYVNGCILPVDGAYLVC